MVRVLPPSCGLIHVLFEPGRPGCSATPTNQPLNAPRPIPTNACIPRLPTCLQRQPLSAPRNPFLYYTGNEVSSSGGSSRSSSRAKTYEICPARLLLVEAIKTFRRSKNASFRQMKVHFRPEKPSTSQTIALAHTAVCFSSSEWSIRSWPTGGSLDGRRLDARRRAAPGPHYSLLRFPPRSWLKSCRTSGAWTWLHLLRWRLPGRLWLEQLRTRSSAGAYLTCLDTRCFSPCPSLPPDSGTSQNNSQHKLITPLLPCYYPRPPSSALGFSSG